MATRQYIGARYVPIFDGAWDNTKEYEPLIIVSYQGNSYTSRTYVPTGIDITNETYWALTGNYNAQVEAYREEVQNYTNSFTDELIATRNITGRNILCIADSYGMSDGVGGWCSQLASLCENIEDVSVYSQVHSGSGFEAQHDQFITLLQTWITNNPTIVDSITDVIVCGGYNDAYYDLTGVQASARIGAFVALCNETFGDGVMVHVGFMAFTTETDIYPKLPACCAKYRQYASLYGAKFIENLQYVCRNTFGLADTRHPTTATYKLCAEHILTYLCNGYADCIQELENNTIWTPRAEFNENLFSNASGYNGVIKQIKINGIIKTKFKFSQGQSIANYASDSDGFTITPNGITTTMAGTLKGFTLGNSLADVTFIPAWIRINSYANIVWNINLGIWLANGEIYVVIPRFQASQDSTPCWQITSELQRFEIIIDDSM